MAGDPGAVEEEEEDGCRVVDFPVRGMDRESLELRGEKDTCSG